MPNVEQALLSQVPEPSPIILLVSGFIFLTFLAAYTCWKRKQYQDRRTAEIAERISSFFVRISLRLCTRQCRCVFHAEAQKDDNVSKNRIHTG